MRPKLFMLGLTFLIAFGPEHATLVWAEAPAAATSQERPAQWAEHVEAAGAPNLNRVTQTFFRSAQPTAEGFQTVAKSYGVKTVVSLRAFHADDDLAAGSGLTLVRIPINTWNIETEDVIAALAAIRSAEQKGPVLLHCQHGADRTGLITALYRVIYQGWTKEDALDEMKRGGFGYHAVWGNIPRFLKRADTASIKAKVETAVSQASVATTR